MPSFTVFRGSKTGAPVQSTTHRGDELKGDEVLVKVTVSGLCGTDLHYRTQDMGLGHEGVGLVEAVGPAVKRLNVGDRVGWGYEHDSCGHCGQCLTGWETFCPKRAMYGHSNLDQGSFATQGIWKESFLFDIPDSLSDIDAAPLQCAGATVFSALQGARPCDVIGVIGVGGLGHLAIQFAAKMGCRVVALSGSASKREEAASLGAHDFIATRDKTELTLARKITRLLVTTSAQPKWNTILPLLDMRAAIYPLSVDEGDFAIPYMELLLQGITVQGSLVASRHVHADMLDFAAFHGIKPVSELFPMTVEGITDAMSKLEQGQVKYRAVLVNEDVE